MATQLKVWDHPFKAAADLSALQFRAMKISAAETVNKATAAGDNAIGILQNKPAAANRAAVVRLQGISKAKAAGTISAGDLLVADSNGDLVKQTASAGTNNGIVGRAMVAAVDNDIFDVLVDPFVMQGA